MRLMSVPKTVTIAISVAVALVYNLGGAPLLVAVKAVLWGIVFALFLWPSVRSSQNNVIANPMGVKQSIKNRR